MQTVICVKIRRERTGPRLAIERIMRHLLAAVLAASLVPACAGQRAAAPTTPAPIPASPSATPGPVQVSEELDPCEERGRYGDGVCDEACPEVDPDCDPKVCSL
jgi:hypothetical protein